MISINESTKILNQGKKKFNKDEVKVIRDFVIKLATIEYESQKNKAA